jgi:hypothetical protein
MKLPAQFIKRLEALERRFAPPRSVMLWVTDGTASGGDGRVHFKLEQGPDESAEAFRVRALRAARAQFPRGTSITWFPISEIEKKL